MNNARGDMTNCTFTAHSSNKGGVLGYLAGGRGFITLSTFTGNRGVSVISFIHLQQAEKDSCDVFQGGVIYIQKTDLVIRDSTLSSNSATGHGGAIYCSDSDLEMDGETKLEGNSAQEDQDIHCSTEIPLTSCRVTGDSPFANLCAEPNANEPLSQGMMIVIGVVVAFGVLCIGLGVVFVVYFMDRKHREQQGLYWNWVKDDEEGGESGKGKDSVQLEDGKKKEEDEDSKEDKETNDGDGKEKKLDSESDSKSDSD